MKIYKDKTMSEQTFILEEVALFDCVLKDCDVFYSGGDFEFVNLKLENTRFHFRGAAKQTQILFQSLGMIPGASKVSSAEGMTSQKPNQTSHIEFGSTVCIRPERFHGIQSEMGDVFFSATFTRPATVF
jgi:hypothetical protein